MVGDAIKGRRAVARRYVRWVRRRNPEASPAEVVGLLERHYIAAVTVAGGVVSAGGIALDAALSRVPGAAKPAKSGARKAAKAATRMGAEQAVKMLPAGDGQLQFEITAVYALAVADIHGMSLEQDQIRALVYGLSNGLVSQKQIAAMAADLANAAGPVGAGRRDLSHWAETLAHSLPAGAAQDLVRGIQTGRLENVRAGLGAKRQAAFEYGVGAVVGGVTRFVFGREVVDAAHEAFDEAPAGFPEHLAVGGREKDDEPNRALAALQGAARSTGSWLGTVSRPFRSEDLDGDGVPDAPRALTAAKGVAGKVAAPFKRRKGVKGEEPLTGVEVGAGGLAGDPAEGADEGARPAIADGAGGGAD